MIDLTLTLTDTSTVTVAAYQADSRSVPSSIQAGPTRGPHPVIRTLGDHQPNVTSLDFTIEVTAATLALAWDAAYTLIEQAEQTENVAWHEGDIDIAALRVASSRPIGPATIRVNLSWLPAKAEVTRRNPTPPVPQTVVLDTFTDTNGTALSSHSPDIDDVGGGWVVVTGLTIPEIQGNRAAAPSGVRAATIDTGITEYTLTAKLTFGAGTNQYAALYVRYADVNNRWQINVGNDPGVGSLAIIEVTGGSATTRATIGSGASPGTHDITVTVTSTGISATVASIGTISYSSAQHAAATLVGLIPRFSGSFVDDFKVDTL